MGTRLAWTDSYPARECLDGDDNEGGKNGTNLLIKQRCKVVWHALHVCFSFFYILQPFSHFPPSEMICFAVFWTTSALEDKFSFSLSISKSLKPIWLQYKKYFANQTTGIIEELLQKHDVTFADNVPAVIDAVLAKNFGPEKNDRRLIDTLIFRLKSFELTATLW